MRIHETNVKSGITRSPEFARKGLAQFAVNVGRKCGHDCRYCSTGAVCRMLKVFSECGENPFGFDYAIVDPTIPDKVARDAARFKDRGMVQFCTLTDAWAPEAQQHRLGRRCLEAILSQPGWTVRILTKNAAVEQDFDLIESYRDRVLVGMSLTALPENEHLTAVVEPNASKVSERMRVIQEAHRRGLRTYGMLCPLLPGIADRPEQIDALVRFAVECGAEEIFAEAVNARGPGLKNCQEALATSGYLDSASAFETIRRQANWSRYVADLIAHVQASVRRHFDINKLRFLQYPSNLGQEDRRQIDRDDTGVVWL